MSSRFFLLLLISLGCEKEPIEPNPRIKPIVGTWKLAEIQVGQDYNKTWQPVPFNEQNNIEVRYDGVILDYKQQGVCCHPKSLDINGSIIEITHTLKVPENTDCVSGCTKCQVWTVKYSTREMILTGCLPSDVKKYKR